jgi:Fibronectin type III domain
MPPNTGHKNGCAIVCADQKINRSVRIMGLSAVLKGKLLLSFILLFGCFRAFSLIAPTGHVALAWQPSSDTNVVGYNVYYGGVSHIYPNMINVGNVTNATVSGLVGGMVYYFAVTAYDGYGDESDFSAEISYLVPNPSTMQIRNAVAGQFVLTLTGQPSHTYEIQATQDFKIWTVIGTATMGAGGSLDFVDTNAANFSQRFYRTLDVSGLPMVQIHSAAGQFILTATGQSGHIYEIQATQDFKTWTVIGTVTMGTAGSIDFTDTNAANFSRRFYRTHDLQP